MTSIDTTASRYLHAPFSMPTAAFAFPTSSCSRSSSSSSRSVTGKHSRSPGSSSSFDPRATSLGYGCTDGGFGNTRSMDMNMDMSMNMNMDEEYELVQDETCVRITMDMPGVNGNDISVSLQDGMLIIEGSRRRCPESGNKKQRLQLQRRIPVDVQVVDVSRAVAQLWKETLILYAPKRPTNNHHNNNHNDIMMMEVVTPAANQLLRKQQQAATAANE